MRPAIDGSAIAPLFGNNPAMGSAAQEMMKKTPARATAFQIPDGFTRVESAMPL